ATMSYASERIHSGPPTICEGSSWAPCRYAMRIRISTLTFVIWKRPPALKPPPPPRSPLTFRFIVATSKDGFRTAGCPTSRRSAMAAQRMSVFCRPFDVIDDDHVHRTSIRFEFQPKLLLDRGEDRRLVRRGLIRRPLEIEVEAPLKPGPVHD